MNPATREEGAIATSSEPLNAGRGSKAEGGAAAPVQNIEQALHAECALWSDSQTESADAEPE